jgi:hypothetical protein
MLRLPPPISGRLRPISGWLRRSFRGQTTPQCDAGAPGCVPTLIPDLGRPPHGLWSRSGGAGPRLHSRSFRSTEIVADLAGHWPATRPTSSCSSAALKAFSARSTAARCLRRTGEQVGLPGMRPYELRHLASRGLSARALRQFAGPGTGSPCGAAADSLCEPPVGIEPTTYALRVRCSGQLS